MSWRSASGRDLQCRAGWAGERLAAWLPGCLVVFRGLDLIARLLSPDHRSQSPCDQCVALLRSLLGDPRRRGHERERHP